MIPVLPECNLLSQFQMSDENFMSFKVHLKSPMDCVISALQLMGILDTFSSNMLRIISCVGFEKKQIEKIFVLYKGFNFEFKSTKNFDEFVNTIETQLQPGYAVFAGYSGHVFIIGRYLDGKMMYIDPQINTICDVNACRDKIKKRGKEYFILFNSKEKLTNAQLESLGFIL